MSLISRTATWKEGRFLEHSGVLIGFFQVTDQLKSGEEGFQEDSSISERPMSNLEKVHFIIGNAILRPAIR